MKLYIRNGEESRNPMEMSDLNKNVQFLKKSHENALFFCQFFCDYIPNFTLCLMIAVLLGSVGVSFGQKAPILAKQSAIQMFPCESTIASSGITLESKEIKTLRSDMGSPV